MQRVYITLNGDDKIAIYNLAPTSGNLTHQEDVEVIGGPAPFGVSPDGQHAYSGLRTAKSMISFAIDESTGTLTIFPPADWIYRSAYGNEGASTITPSPGST